MRRLPASVKIERKLKKEVLRRRALSEKLHVLNESVLRLQEELARALFIERESERLLAATAKCLRAKNPWTELIKPGKFPRCEDVGMGRP